MTGVEETRHATHSRFDVLLKGATVIDPSQGLHGELDLAVRGGRIAKIAEGIPESEASTSFALRGKIVTPGLIDAHCHPVLGLTDHSVAPSDAGAPTGVLLVNDAGSAGPANFPVLFGRFGGGSDTRMTYFLNAAAEGLVRSPEIASDSDVDLELLRGCVARYGEVIRGIKIRAMEPLSRIDADLIGMTVAAAADLALPLMVHIGEFRERRVNDPFDLYSRSVVRNLKEGDILSHFMTEKPGGMVLPDGTIYPELLDARERGVILDSSHGWNNFSFKVARVLMKAGVFPDIITTDLAALGLPAVQSLPVTMSKFLNLGLPLAEVIAATTLNAAKALRIENDWGSLAVGRRADVSVLELVHGAFAFSDGGAGNTLEGDVLLEPVMVLREGRALPCRSAYHPVRGVDACG